MKRLFKSFGFAWRGLWYCLRHERHFRIHLVFAAYMLVFAPAFSLSRTQWAVLFLTIALVTAAEAVNTAIERAVDLGTKGSHHLAKVAKDAAAGAVLLCAIASVAVGLALFGYPDKLAEITFTVVSQPRLLVPFIISLIAALLFIFKGGRRGEKRGFE